MGEKRINSKKTNFSNKIEEMENIWFKLHDHLCYYSYYTECKKIKSNQSFNIYFNRIIELFNDMCELHSNNNSYAITKNQIKAYYFVGSLYTEKGNYDNGCKYLLKAKELIDKYSLIESFCEYYVNICNYIVTCYLEKHHNNEDTDKYMTIAERVFSQYCDKYFHKNYKLCFEIVMKRLIFDSNIYSQDTICDVFEASERVSNCIQKGKEIIEIQSKKYKNNDIMTHWLQKSKDTLYTSAGVYYKWLYFNNIRDRNRINTTLCFNNLKEAVNYFVLGLSCNPNNTICLGNIAQLLYRTQNNEIFKDQYKWIKKELLNEKKLEKKNDTILNKRSHDDIFDFITERILLIDSNNMFTLNLLAFNEINKEINKESLIKVNFNMNENYPHVLLLHGELCKRFKSLENCAKKNRLDNMMYLNKLKIYIIKLYNYATHYINKSIVSKKDFEGLKVGHYTRANVVSKLFDINNKVNFHIRNVKHLNDPTEGILFMDYLSDNISKLKNKNECDLLNNIKSVYDLKNSDFWSEKSSVYIGCFTSRLDQLNMWSRYGNQGKGCCLSFYAKDVFDDTTDMSLTFVPSDNDEQKYEIEYYKCPLYIVTYLPQNKNFDLEIDIDYANKRARAEKYRYNQLKVLTQNLLNVNNELISEKDRSFYEQKWWKKQAELIRYFKLMMEKIFPQILIEIQNECNNIHGKLIDFKEFDNEVKNIIMIILDQVRFLVKDKVYRDEREYRVLQYSNSPLIEEFDSNMPYLYINLSKNINYDEIIFGPVTNNYSSDSTFILNLKNKKIKTRKSKIPYWI